MSSTNFDYCADSYGSIMETPWVKHADLYSLLSMMGDLSGKTILDLGCGEGYFARSMKEKGAAGILGVDMSEELVNIALTHEKQAPLGVRYLCDDITKLHLEDQLFDTVVSTYVLSLAPNRDILYKMAMAAYSHLKKGGAFYISDDNMDLSPSCYPLTSKYGFEKKIDGTELVEGTPVYYHIKTLTETIDVEATYIPLQIWETILREVGFQSVKRHPPIISPEGIDLFGKAYWDDYVKSPLSIYIEAIK